MIWCRIDCWRKSSSIFLVLLLLVLFLMVHCGKCASLRMDSLHFNNVHTHIMGHFWVAADEET